MKSKTAKILGILVSVLVLFASCGQLMNDGESTVSVNLPYVNNGNSRAVSSDDIQRIKGDHASYRVHINDRVLEGRGGNFSATFPVGVRVDVFIECVNAKGEVILRTVTKSVVVAVGGNDIDFNLKEDGTEIIPESQKGRVIYTYGEAESKPGDRGGLPADNTIYRPGDTFTVQNGGSMTWTHATAFTGWKTNVALTGDTNASAGNVDAGGDVQLGGTYIMPEGGVVLMAQWQKRTYHIEYNDNASNSGGMQTTSQMPSTGNITALENATIPSVDLQPVNANGKNYTFTGYWLTDSNGTDGKRYRAGDTIPMTADITLYAQWSDKNVYTVTYNTGAGPTTASVSGLDSNTVNVIDGNSIMLPMLQATGYTFNGWKVTSGGSGDYDGGANYIPTATVTLTAQWTAIEYTISVNGNGASGTLSNPFSGSYTVDGSNGTQSTVDVTSIPTNGNTMYSGKVFDGWAFTASGTKLSSNQTISSILSSNPPSGNTITLYAKWADAMASVTIGSTETNYPTSSDFNTIMSVASNQTATIKLFSNVTGVSNANATQSTVTLNLNGHTITGNSSNAVLQVALGSTLTLTDVNGNTGKIQGGSIGIEVQSGTLVMNGGTITGNNGTYGGGVSLTGATFTMNDGVISGNTASSYGGGVYVDQGSSFTMTDGTISGNTAANGGGVYVETQGSNSGRFTMTGGSITDNTADTDAGGVYTTTVNLGSADSAQNKVITITGNTLNGTACNVSGIKTSASGVGGGINMQAQLAVGSSIGITAPKAPMIGAVATTGTYFTTGWDKSWDKSVFVPDDSSATLVINNSANGAGQLMLQ